MVAKKCKHGAFLLLIFGFSQKNCCISRSNSINFPRFISDFVVFFNPKKLGKLQEIGILVFDFSQQQRAKGVGMAFKLKKMTGGLFTE